MRWRLRIKPLKSMASLAAQSMEPAAIDSAHVEKLLSIEERLLSF